MSSAGHGHLRLRLPAVVVLVGAAASGKTTLRHRLVTAGLEPRLVVSLDDERCRLQEEARRAGRAGRPAQDYTLPALRAADRRYAALLRAGRGYLADATNLRRRERRAHLARAAAHGLPARAVLLRRLDVATLTARDAGRPEPWRVPADVLARHAHRHGLLDPALLLEEGFAEVLEADPGGGMQVEDSAAPRRLATPYGDLTAHVHEHPDPRAGAVLVGGIGDDVDGPGGAYVPLAERLRAGAAATVLRVSYRRVGDLRSCVDDVLGALAWLAERGVRRVVLVGWSFGGAVVVQAGAVSGAVVGVATLATQGYGADPVAALAPRSLLLVHGTADRVLPFTVSEQLHARAGEPRRLLAYEGAGHDVAGHEDRFVDDVTAWAVPLLTADR